MTDVEIPRSAWSAWTPDDGPRQLRRPLTDDERHQLIARRDELAPMVAPFLDHETQAVELAIADMFGGFHSMRQTGEDALAVVVATRRALREFPLWAIERGCHNIQTLGVWRDGKFERQWPPSDAEIATEVRACLRLFADQHRSAVALLGATVETQ